MASNFIYYSKLTSMAGANASATMTNETLNCRFHTLSDYFHIKAKNDSMAIYVDYYHLFLTVFIFNSHTLPPG